MPLHNILGSIRRSQVVSTYGPGSIVDFRAGASGDAAISAVACGLDSWVSDNVPPDIRDATVINEPRLARMLHVTHFRLAPVAPQPPRWKKNAAPRSNLMARRFPGWLQCPGCHRIAESTRWQRGNPGDTGLKCPQCSSSQDVYVVPVRFVMACNRGHLEDFPWSWWVHRGRPCTNERLYLRSSGTGLAGLVAYCSSCDSEQSMESALSRSTWANRRCGGHRPWLGDRESDCIDAPEAVQRGATNLYFAKVESSLDIPPWSNALVSTLGRDWASLLAASPEERRTTLKVFDNAQQYTRRLGMTIDEIVEQIGARARMLADLQPDDLRTEEYQRMLQKDAETVTDQFKTRHHATPEALQKHVHRVVEVQRLREVRALCGFTRITPPADKADEKDRLAPLSRERMSWLPAVEVRGEGIFVELDPAAIDAWQARHAATIEPRIARMREAHEQAWTNAGRTPPAPEKPIQASYLLVHTLAHALIRQLSLDCGYSSASLRERLYVRDTGTRMSGLLIYTASSDADGTLGGLSRQAAPARFRDLFVESIRSLLWCSNDPLCIHGEASTEPLNRAACHACALVAETSCETFNTLLDRSVLVGTPDDRKSGFFASLLPHGA
jgi:hypothetical protein